MTPDEGKEAMDEGDEASIQALRNYWDERIQEFERVEFPVFYARGYSKNTALMVVMMDELSDALSVAAAIKRGQIERA